MKNFINKIYAQHHRSNRNCTPCRGIQPFIYHLRNAGYTCILGHHGVMGKGRKTDVNFKSRQIGEWDGKEIGFQKFRGMFENEFGYY